MAQLVFHASNPIKLFIAMVRQHYIYSTAGMIANAFNAFAFDSFYSQVAAHFALLY
jgi:hypothetical protein